MNKIIVDKARLLRRVIVISWISLALCFVIKIFGSNFFEIMCQSPNYKALCEYADTHFWLKYVIAILSSFFCQTLYCLSIVQRYKFKKWELITTILCVVVSCYVKLKLQQFSFIFDIILLALLPCLFLGKQYKKYWQVPIAFGLTTLFQVVSLVVKNVGFVNVADTYFIGLIYSIDVYIMCILYYLYRNFQKEKEKMGALWVLFMGKPADKLKAMREKRLAKIAKLQAEINAIEIELSKKKDEK